MITLAAVDLPDPDSPTTATVEPRGTEILILLSTFVNKYIDSFDETLLSELETFLNFEDEIILNYYNYNIIKKKIDENKVARIFKKFKI